MWSKCEHFAFWLKQKVRESLALKGFSDYKIKLLRFAIQGWFNQKP